MHDVSAILSQKGNAFLADVIGGLSGAQKTLPCRWLYDKLGSDLFEAITGLEAYYPTRAETEILRVHSPEIAAFAGDGPVLVEYGAGAGVKTSLMLAALNSPRGYVPIDIAGEYLAQTVEKIASRFPALWVRPVAADFLSVFDLPAGVPAGQRIGFFPGSTIGNLDETEATAFLTQMHRHVGARGGAIIGVDLLKDVSTLVRAYDDPAGVTAQFNLNLLARINRELGGDFRLECFRHEARWNDVDRSVEMHLVSVREQWVSVGEVRFHFEQGETIHTESSRKYDLDGFTSLAAGAGWDVVETWLDAKGQFCVFALRPSNEGASHQFFTGRARKQLTQASKHGDLSRSVHLPANLPTKLSCMSALVGSSPRQVGTAREASGQVALDAPLNRLGAFADPPCVDLENDGLDRRALGVVHPECVIVLSGV